MNPTVQIVLAIATIVCSGIVSVIISHWFTVSRVEREFKRKKLEELFLAVDKYCKGLMAWNLVWPSAMRGEIDYNQARDLQIENNDGIIGHNEPVEMLVTLYFPELRPDLNRILACRDNMNHIQAAFRKSYQQRGDTKSFIKPFNDEFLKLADEEEAFKKRMTTIANKIK